MEKHHKEAFEIAIEAQIKKYGGGDFERNTMRTMAKAMSRAHIEPAKIYAYCKTGLLVAELPDGSLNIDWRPTAKQDKKEYAAAFNEFLDNY